VIPIHKRPVLIDTDTASDDAVALIMALRSREITVEAITVVAGNVPLQQATQNALFTVELCGSDVPVFRGAEGPLARPLEMADWFHGREGLGDHGYAPQQRKAEAENAVDAIVRIVRANRGIEVITLGPLTNLALALRQDPSLAANIGRCVVMGGAPCCEGNVTPAAEFNIWVDPEAARIVFRSDLPIEMVGWQLSRDKAVVTLEEIELMRALGTPFADFAVRCNSTALDAFYRQTGERGFALPDPVAMALLLEPALSLESSKHLVEIETASELTRGMTVVDRLGVASDERNRRVWADARAGTKAAICWKLDVAGWKRALFAALS
jgi:purine nucleosidase